jgi:tetratricopeptide (TPR) repeat protein
LPDAHERRSAAAATVTKAPAAVAAEQAALTEDVDLDPATRRYVLDFHAKLEGANHYELLRVEPGADRKVLRRAYFDLAAQFHPDRYFRKRLGSFQSRMEEIFGRVTLAHDTLADPELRAEYDVYLDEQQRARDIERVLAEAFAEAARAGETVEREVRAQEAASPSFPPPAPPTPAAGSPSGSHRPPPPSLGPPRPRTASSPQFDPSALGPRVASSPQFDPSVLGPPRPRAPSSPQFDPSALGPPRPRAASSPQIDVSARRDALAKRLLGGRAAGSSSSPPPRTSAAPPPVQTATEAMDALRRRYEERVWRAKTAQARKYAANGEAALARGDTVAAANAFRVAATLSPNDPTLERSATDAQSQAEAVLGETYARQASYEEKTAQWAEAARSWTRVCAVRPNDADAHERAANAIIQTGGNLQEASRLAERACALDASQARFRVTLAQVYIAAGLSSNARRELETAAQLDPQDGNIQAMMKGLAP